MMPKPRVLLLSASSGAGHVRAAQALEKAFLGRGDCYVEHLDAIHYVSRLFQRIYGKAYISMVRRAQQLMGVLYNRTDQALAASASAPRHGPAEHPVNDPYAEARAAGLVRRDALVPAEIITGLIAKRKLHARNAIVVTDYDVHVMWLCRTVDRYYVAIQVASEYLSRIGVPRENHRVTGIPSDPLFATPLDKAAARKHLRLHPAAQMILIATGGYGIGPVEQLVLRSIQGRGGSSRGKSWWLDYLGSARPRAAHGAH